MFDDDGDEEVQEVTPAVRFDPFDFVVITVRLASDVHDAFGGALVNLHNRLAMHSHWRLKRREFAAVVGKEIEAMANG